MTAAPGQVSLSLTAPAQGAATAPEQVRAGHSRPAQGATRRSRQEQEEEQERVYKAQRERLCRLGDACQCDHTRCRAGWLDEETTVTYLTRHPTTGETHQATRQEVTRCFTCHQSWEAHIRQMKQAQSQGQQ